MACSSLAWSGGWLAWQFRKTGKSSGIQFSPVRKRGSSGKKKRENETETRETMLCRDKRIGIWLLITKGYGKLPYCSLM